MIHPQDFAKPGRIPLQEHLEFPSRSVKSVPFEFGRATAPPLLRGGLANRHKYR
jgi:hypothetical protein